jgi:succinyl-CoA synthetase alpha subunit
MSILINRETRLIVQGITGAQGRFHTGQMLAYGTQVCAGVTPGKGGITVADVPVFNTVVEAVLATGANTSVIYVPPAFASDSILEAVDAQLDLVVCITEGIPVLDMVRVKKHLEGKKTRLLGPNCPGLITPAECKVGILPAAIHKKGHIGVISRSGTLTYEAVAQLSGEGIGQSTAVGIGGDPVKGLGFMSILKLFNEDPETYGIVMIGEIGGTDEQRAAEWIGRNMTKPVVGFVAGQTAPPGRRMGHAGAIISGESGTAAQKVAMLRQNGIQVAETPDLIGKTMVDALKDAGIYEKCL